MALTQQLWTLGSHFHPPDNPARKVVRETLDDWITAFDGPSAVQAGDRLPDFTLYDRSGNAVTRASLLASLPSPSRSTPPSSSPLLLMVIVRGEWCSFCKMQMRELARRADDFAAAGVHVVVISPELPEYAGRTEDAYFTAARGGTVITVLADKDNSLSRLLGLVWAQPPEMRPVLEGFGHDLPGRNGNDKFEVPVPTSLLVDGQGIVRRAHVDPDFMKRVEPDAVLEWVKRLRQNE